ncbi:hypothetical protein ABDK96_15705 [Citricoccus nitrophenolicus]|uniref:Transposase n=1 Tax=Citricoccus nitrophenolicus TaxID=863575 RepID=A0ABV0INE3_9MICC
MSVIIPPRQYSRDERQRLVLEYLEQPFGSKAEFLDDRQIAQHRMYRWRKALAYRDGDNGLMSCCRSQWWAPVTPLEHEQITELLPSLT